MPPDCIGRPASVGEGKAEERLGRRKGAREGDEAARGLVWSVEAEA